MQVTVPITLSLTRSELIKIIVQILLALLSAWTAIAIALINKC
jgi:hypothetical protein